MSGYDLFGFHATSNGEEGHDAPFAGAVRVLRTDSVASDGSDSSGERSGSLANFTYGSSSSSHVSDGEEADARGETQPTAERQPTRSPPVTGTNEHPPAERRQSMESSPYSLSSHVKQTDPLTPPVDDGRNSVPLAEGSMGSSFADMSLFEGSGASPVDQPELTQQYGYGKDREGHDDGLSAQTKSSGSDSGPPVMLKSILQKQSSFRRPGQRTSSTGKILGSRRSTATNGTSGTDDGGDACPDSAPSNTSGWKIADDNSGFYVPTDIMQNLDFSNSDHAHSRAPPPPVGRRPPPPSGSRPSTRSTRPIAQTARPGSRGQPHTQPSSRRGSASKQPKELQRRLSMRGPVLSSSEASDK